MIRVLVTGGGGFIGRHVLPLLVAEGVEVHAIHHASAPLAADGRVHWHQADIFDGPRVRALLRHILPDQLVHLAWYTTPPRYWEASENALWLEASIRLFREFADAGGKRLMAIGTCAEYDWNDGYCNEDSTALAPQSLYGQSKKALQTALVQIVASGQISAAWARLFFPYGPGEHPSKLVTDIATALLKGQRALCATPELKRDFIYVADVASAIVAILRSDFTGAINIGTGVPVTMREIAEKVARKIGRIDLLDFAPLDSSKNAAPLVVADVVKLRGLIHWTPGCSLDEGLERTIRHRRQRGNS